MTDIRFASFMIVMAIIYTVTAFIYFSPYSSVEIFVVVGTFLGTVIGFSIATVSVFFRHELDRNAIDEDQRADAISSAIMIEAELRSIVVRFGTEARGLERFLEARNDDELLEFKHSEFPGRIDGSIDIIDRHIENLARHVTPECIHSILEVKHKADAVHIGIFEYYAAKSDDGVVKEKTSRLKSDASLMIGVIDSCLVARDQINSFTKMDRRGPSNIHNFRKIVDQISENS